MTFLDLKAELAQAIPGMSRIYAGTLINRAWRLIRDTNLWSFQLFIGSFSTPGILTTGTVTVQPNPVNYVFGDTAASTAWYYLVNPVITQRQFRVGNYSIYNIIGVDFSNYDPGDFSLGTQPSGYAILTLDRPFTDRVGTPAGYGQGPYGGGGYGGAIASLAYQIFQCYYPAPSPTFKRWLSVQDVVNGYGLGIWTARRDINFSDPMRQLTANPVVVMGIGQDKRPNSATLNWPMDELWPVPTAQLSYTTYYVDRGADLQSNADELPSPITDDVVLYKARAYAYEWAEARKDVMAAKGSGANYARLKQDAEGDFLARLKTLRLEDRDTVNAFMSRMNNQISGLVGINPWYNTTTNRAGMGFPVGIYR